MDMVSRRRVGKGVGVEHSTGNLPIADQSGLETHRGEEAQRSGRGSDESRPLLESGEGQLGVDQASATASDAAQAHPSWSTRAQEELRLQTARPDHLPNPDFL